MSVDLSTKPKIPIELDPVLEAYCRYIFSTPENQNEIIVTRRHPVGKRLTSICDEMHFLPRNPSLKNKVVFILPITIKNKHRIRRCFLKIDEWEKEKFNDYVKSEFNLWLREEFYRGYEILKWDQKTIVNAICRKLNIRFNAVNSATITKNDYRNRVYVEKMRADLLESF